MSLVNTKKKVKITDVKANLAKNVRFATDFEVAGQKIDTYDLPDMIDQIIVKRGIVTPLVLNKELEDLQGFRRTLAGQAIARDPERYIPDPAVRKEVLEALDRVDAIVYTNLTPDEETDLINDHGDRKGIGRTELVNAVWKMYNQGYNGPRISNQMYYALAEYTGNVKKLNDLAGMSQPERQKRIKTWFHGTVDNYLIAAHNMGPRIRDALLLTEMRTDGLIKKDSEIKPLFVVKRDRIVELSKARSQDEKDGKWDDIKKTGPAFELLIDKFKNEDVTGKSESTDNRLTKTELSDRATSALSSAFRAVYNIAGGKPVAEAPELDKLAASAEAKFNLINKHMDQINNPELQDVLGRVVHQEPHEFEQWLLRHCNNAVPVAEVVNAG